MPILEQIAVATTLLNGAAVLSAAAIDLYTRKIPNIFVAVMLSCALVHAAVVAPGLILQHLLCGLYVGIVGVIFFQRKVLGGGDVKMIASLAVWFLPQQLMSFVIWVLIFGGVLSALYLAMIAVRLATERLAPKVRLPKVDPAGGMAYGVATACGFAFCAWKVL